MTSEFSPDIDRLCWGAGEVEPPAVEVVEPPKFIACPFTPIIDTREQSPFAFANIPPKDVKARGKHVVAYAVKPVFRALPTGDYSLPGFEDRIIVERKSHADLYNSLGKNNRERFEREHERMAAIIAAGGRCYVIVETDERTAFTTAPEFSGLDPRSVEGSVRAWRQRFNVHWQFMSDRRAAEIETFRILERFFADREKEQRPRKRTRATQ